MKHRIAIVAIAGFLCLLSTSATYPSYSSERGTAVHSTGDSDNKAYPNSSGGKADNPDFSIAITPDAATIAQGSNTSYTASVASSNGFADLVSLSAGGFGSGATGTFNPPSISGAGSSTLTVTTTGTAQTGSFTLTIMGSSGSLLHTRTATLTINPVGGTARLWSTEAN